MAKTKAVDGDIPENEKRLNLDLKKRIEDAIFQQKKIASDNEAYSESIAAIAEDLGIKPAVLKRRIALIIKEEEKGGEIKSKETDITFAEEYFTIKDKNEYN